MSHPKSTIKTSRKIYAMGEAFKMIGLTACLYTILELCGKDPSELFFTAVITAIGTTVSALHIADGMKGHEANTPTS